ncbi:hypothetical protein EGU54_17060 [Achromobacter aegrifaciens]|nr:hypothetical protein EGU54_17060 [Achromobacter aegrifaciens]
MENQAVSTQKASALKIPDAVPTGESLSSKSIDWREEFRAAAGFLRDHWALLGLTGLVLSVVAMHSYLVQEAIPLGIASQEIITSLPMLFILVVIAVVSLGGSIMLPTAVMVGRHKEFSQSLLDEVLRQAGDAKERQRAARMRLLAWWTFGLVTPSVLVVLILQWDGWQSNPMGYFVLLPLATLLFMGSVVVVVSRTVPDTWRQHVQKRWGVILSCGFAQMVVVVSLSAILETRFFSSATPKFFFLLLLVMVLLALVQAAFAWIVRDLIQGPGVLMRAMGTAGFVMFTVCMLPPLNHFLVGYVMQSSATGGRGCTVFTWKEKADVLKGLKQYGQGPQSVPLRVPMAIPGIYFVRPWDGSWSTDIALVSVTDVAKASKCSR